MDQALGSRMMDTRAEGRTEASAESRSQAALSAAPSASSWGAIIAGAFVATSVSVVLIALGSGLGFASMSPWPGHGVTAGTFTVTTAVWLILTQWIAASLGGYIAGRLRTRWVGTHTHEVFFRDTAHGFITWSLATVLVALLVASSAMALIGGGVRMASPAAAAGVEGAVSGAGAAPSPAMSYGLERLFRPAESASRAPSAADAQTEAGHIIANALATGAVPEGDRTYLAELVAARTGVSGAQAQRRVDDFIAAAQAAEAKARAAADAARKAAAEASLFTALALLIGAFIASVSAALGGRLRDQHP